MLAALSGGDRGNAAGVDDNQVGRAVGIDLCKSELFEELSDLLAFVLVDFATERVDGKSFHWLYFIEKQAVIQG